jgi:acyl-coenzyme A synthetase/AMP-(fatty) acid ligase
LTTQAVRPAVISTWFDHILFQMRAQAETPALVMEDRAVTYVMLKTGVERCASRIAALNIPRDGLIAILVQNPVRHITLCLALLRIGMPSISIAPNQTGIGSLAFAAVLGDHDAAKFVAPGNRLIEVTDAWFSDDVAGLAPLPAGFASSSDICRASLTSGSTGAPKTITHSVANIGHHLLDKTIGCIDGSRSSVLCMPGLTSTFGFTTACATLASGRTLCFAQSPFQAIRMIELFRIDFVMAATEQMLALTRVARKTGAQLRSLQTVWFGGSLPSRALLEAAMIYLCKNVNCRYGTSEIGLVARATARELLSNPSFVGHVAPGIEVGIFDSQGSRCADGRTGFVKMRAADAGSPWIDLGDVGWHRDSRLHIVGRSSDVNAASARDIQTSMHEAEHLLRLEWDVVDAAAVLIDEKSPAEIWIGVVDGKDADAGELADMLRMRGIDHRVRLFDLKAIPRGASGKVNRPQLKAVMLAATGKPVTA